MSYEDPNRIAGTTVATAMLFPRSQMTCENCSAVVTNETTDWVRRGLWRHAEPGNTTAHWFCCIRCSLNYEKLMKGMKLLQSLSQTP